jgi:Protein of unknown function (DUF3014)
MAFDDLPLNGPAATGPPPGRPPSPTRWVVVGAGAVIAGALLALWWMSRAQPDTATPAPTTATDVTLGSKRPKRQPIDLPSIEESDSLLRDLVSTLSRHPTLARFLATDGLIRATTLAVSQMAEGRTPAVPLAALRPSSRLQILGTATGQIDPKSYTRWDSATTALTSINPEDAAQLYVNVKPLFDQAYRELGHSSGDFDEAIVAAIGRLAETPQLDGDPILLKRPAYYEHDDQTLRALPPVQKQFLLVGPDNRRRIMAWLQQFAADLDLKVG